MEQRNFLKKIDEQLNRENYVKITLLSIDDKPIQVLEGQVVSGSINIDGSSCVARTCSLSLVALDLNDTFLETYWCFNSKFKLEIGVIDQSSQSLNNIVWFNMGIYLITSFNKNENQNNITFSISGKDKMCRLNGEMGGNMPAKWDWGSIEELDEENEIIKKTKVPIKEIIYRAIHQFSQEPIKNIIINDLDTYGYEVWEYLGDEPLFYLKEKISKNFKFMTFDSKIRVFYKTANGYMGECFLSELDSEQVKGKYYSVNALDPMYNNNATIVAFAENENIENFESLEHFYVVRVEKEEAAGYHQIPLVYNTELMLNAGETVKSLLDKIVSMLGNFEYFYNINGQFVFQKKRDYVKELWSTSSGALSTPLVYDELYSYRFDDEKMFISISTSPNIGNIKNDFIVWGIKNPGNYPIHARCALDKKPVSYISPWQRYSKTSNVLHEKIKDSVLGYYFKENNEYVFEKEVVRYEEGSEIIGEAEVQRSLEKYVKINTTALSEIEDTQIIEWRKADIFTHEHYENYIGENERIYGVEYGKGIYIPDKELVVFEVKLELPQKGKVDEDVTNIKFPTLNQENSNFLDLKSFIKELEKRKWNLYVKLDKNREYSVNNYDWREIIYQMAIDFNKWGTNPEYYLQLEKANPQYLNGKTGYEQYYIDLEGFWRHLYDPNPLSNNDNTYYEENDDKPFWNTNIHNNPSALLFWFEFLDSQGELSKYSVYNIGSRTKVLNENNTTSIYQKEISEIQFVVSENNEIKEPTNSYAPMQISKDDMDLFYRSSQGPSAIQRINELMYENLYLAETININSLPIYYLQPNTRIYVKDKGDYTINKISYTLTHNGNMTISASKIYKEFI